MKFVRYFAAVVIGFALFVAAVRMVSPSDGLALNATCTIAAAIVSGYLIALIAGSREMPVTSTVGLLMVVASFEIVRQEGLPRPGWYEMTIAGCGPVSLMLGAAIRLLTKRPAKNPPTAP